MSLSSSDYMCKILAVTLKNQWMTVALYIHHIKKKNLTFILYKRFIYTYTSYAAQKTRANKKASGVGSGGVFWGRSLWLITIVNLKHAVNN